MKILQAIILIFIFIISLILFFPKDIAFFELEKILKKQNIIINEKFITPKVAGFIIKDGDIYIDSMNLIHFQQANLNAFIIYNSLDIKNLKIDTLNIPELKIELSIMHPTKILIISQNINGFIDLIKRKIFIKMQNPQKLRYLFRKTSDGYIYEQNF